MNTLVARIGIIDQYDPPTKTITYRDDVASRWQKVYGKLQPGDNGIFIGKSNIVLIGKLSSKVDKIYVRFENIIEVPISNDQFLQLDEAYPEFMSQVKANFSPFIHKKEIDIKSLIDSALIHRFVSYYIVQGKSILSNAKNLFLPNDRLIVLENSIVIEILKYTNNGTVNLDLPRALPLKDYSLQDILQIHRTRNEGNSNSVRRVSNNVRRVENIINILNTQPVYKFDSFFAYHDTIHNNRAYGKVDDTDLMDEESELNNMQEPYINQILFGPPGTGKTYHTISEAIRITDSDFFNTHKNNREKLNERFRELLIKDWTITKGQIAFCTFHQSFSYEDFVEGIKPVKPEVGDSYLKYKIEDGIFKRICALSEDDHKSARLKSQRVISWNEDTFKKATFYKVSLGNSNDSDDQAIYEYCIKNNCIALGYGGETDFTGLDEEQIVKKCKELGKESFTEQAVNRFIHYIKVGNYVLVSNGNRYVRAIGKVTGPYRYDPNTSIRYRHFRPVEWLSVDQEIPIGDLYDRSLSQQTLYKLDEAGIKKEFFVNSGQKIEAPDSEKNFVLIIDEINRGNVSSVFGELITLIEIDKRAAGDEVLEVTLPYSKSLFKVPSNVYLIGTMNTADRSIEALDTALRRRFSFQEMPPKESMISSASMIWGLLWKYRNVDWNNEPYRSKENSLFEFIGAPSDLIEKRKEIWKRMKDEKEPAVHQIEWLIPFQYSGIQLDRMLLTINQRIEKLIDKDHKIGHAYFMNVLSTEDLKDVFQNKIIPLLQEYFFGDYGKIGLVLGNSFVEKVNDDFKFAKFEGYDSSVSMDLKERPVFRIADIEKWDFFSIYE